MGYYDTGLNTPIVIPLEIDYQDNGWAATGDGKASHIEYNSGELRLDVFKTEVDRQYELSFNVESLSNGTIKVSMGGTTEDVISAGEKKYIITSINVSNLIFWSDATTVISNIEIKDTLENKICYIYNSDELKFGGDRSYYPETMTAFLDTFFSFKDGSLWRHDANEVRNSFYGEKYESSITFVVNDNMTALKTLKYIRLISNLPWDVTEVRIAPREGKKLGQLSRITKNNFQNIQGQWFASFLKDMNDPRFNNKLQALFEGADLQGAVIEITVSIKTDNEVRMSAIQVAYTDNMFTF